MKEFDQANPETERGLWSDKKIADSPVQSENTPKHAAMSPLEMMFSFPVRQGEPSAENLPTD